MFLAHLAVQGPRNPERPRRQHSSAQPWTSAGCGSNTGPAGGGRKRRVVSWVWTALPLLSTGWCGSHISPRFHGFARSSSDFLLWLFLLRSATCEWRILRAVLLVSYCCTDAVWKAALNLSAAYNLKHYVHVRGSVSQLRFGSSGLGRAGSQVAGLVEVCFTSRGLWCQITEMQDSRNKHETASRTVWWCSENSAHTVASTHVFFLVRASHTWPGSRSVRQGSKQCLREWERLPSHRARRKHMSFRDSVKNWEQSSNQL